MQEICDHQEIQRQLCFNLPLFSLYKVPKSTYCSKEKNIKKLFVEFVKRLEFGGDLNEEILYPGCCCALCTESITDIINNSKESTVAILLNY